MKTLFKNTAARFLIPHKALCILKAIQLYFFLYLIEPLVASSDATNMECQIRKDGEYYIVNGRKWWSSGELFLADAFHTVSDK